MNHNDEIKVWDPVVRWFHWLLVAAFFTAYVTEEDVLTVHVWAGYTVGALLVVRLVWGFVGTRHARFSDFVTRPGQALLYLADSVRLNARRYLGHNPIGGLMVVTMMFSLLGTVISGLGVYGIEHQAGPLAEMLAGAASWEDGFEEVHEWFANFTLLLVLVHVAGVLLESLIHRENLVKSMFTGRKRA